MELRRIATLAALAFVLAACSDDSPVGPGGGLAPPARPGMTVWYTLPGQSYDLRNGPHSGYTVTGQKIASGGAVNILCYVRGQSVRSTDGSGSYSDVWNKVENHTWIPDAYVNTGSYDPVVPACRGSTVAATIAAGGPYTLWTGPGNNAYYAANSFGTVAGGTPVKLACTVQGKSVSANGITSRTWYKLNSARWINRAYLAAAPSTAPQGCWDYDPDNDDMWEWLAGCEASHNWAINTGNGYYGGLQFSYDSWSWVGGSGYPHQNTRKEQIYRGKILHSRQGWHAWPACTGF